MNEKRIFSRKRICALTAAVLSVLDMPVTYGADFSLPDFEKNVEAESPYLATEYVYSDGRPFAELKYLRTGEGIGLNSNWLVRASAYDLDKSLIEATNSSTAYWAGILGKGAKNTTPWQIFVNTDNSPNASAASHSVNSDGERPAKESIITEQIYVKDQLQDGVVFKPITYEEAQIGYLPKGKYAYSDITVGAYMGANRTGAINGWWVDTDSLLPTNEQAADFVGTFRHELGHALGISFPCVSAEILGEKKVLIDHGIKDKNAWTLHLVDQNGNAAKSGMPIVTPQQAADPTKCFVVDRKPDGTGKGYAYFVGEHVTEALGGATFFGRSGLPVNGWEKDPDGYDFEGSHFQTAGMMSHRIYTNYTSFLEVELAAMQDLGYSFDRKAYFGRSIYGNGGDIINHQGYFKRNAEGTAYLDNVYSLIPLGIGLHIYGSDNKVTQNANILTTGTGAVGVRVDGTDNTLNVPENTEIHADGRRGNGLLLAYGRNHIVNQNGTVTASGEGGTGARFDFGSSSNGAVDEYRGSYIRYIREVQDIEDKEADSAVPKAAPKAAPGTILSAKNLDLLINDANEYNANPNELNGPLVKEYNLSGTLKGGENAIYIGKNAFVQKININKGANIQGNITSDWKQFGAAECEKSYDGVKGDGSDILAIQYNNSAYRYDVYIPDLVTQVNFNTDMQYNGRITGEDNMKMNVQSGTLIYGGTANVVSVQVAEDAALLGGSYIVNDMSSKMHTDFAVDTTTGYVINSGTIGAASADENMTINGNLVSNGRLQAYGGGEGGQIIVTGNAYIDGSTATAVDIMPGESKTVLKAKHIEGNVANANTALPVAPMLGIKGRVSGNTLTAEMEVMNNLGSTETAVNDTFNAVKTMYDNMGTEKYRQPELQKLFSMDEQNAVSTLKDISAPNAVQGMTLAQKSTMTSHILSSRLTDAFARKTVAVPLPTAKLTADKQETVQDGLHMQAQIDQPVDNDIWFKTGKNWGELKGGAHYHGTTLALGYDKAVGKNWRVGGFVSYGSSSFAAGSAGTRLKDTRFGLYGGYKGGPHEGFVYLSHGWLKNDLSRGITGIGTAKADYNSHLLELGGEYKYDLQAGKAAAWHISPYLNMQLSRLWQDSYTENGVGALGQKMNSAANTYFAAGLGVEFKRYLSKGSYAMRAGLRHAFCGADPRVTFGYAGGGPTTYEMRGRQDKTHLLLSLSGETEFSPGWTLSGDAALERGSHDRDVMCAVTLRRMW